MNGVVCKAIEQLQYESYLPEPVLQTNSAIVKIKRYEYKNMNIIHRI